MTGREMAKGWILLPVFFVAFPFLFSFSALLLGSWLHTEFSEELINVVYYTLLTVCVALAFHRFLGDSLRRLLQRPGPALTSVLLGLVFYLGLQLILSPFAVRMENLNNERLVTQALQNPPAMFFMTVFLAPLVEETIFRGVVFGSIRRHSRLLAYLLSALLFGLLHVWQQIFTTGDFGYAILLLQYIAPSLVLAWCYDRSGNILAPMALHGAINGLSLLSVLI